MQGNRIKFSPINIVVVHEGKRGLLFGNSYNLAFTSINPHLINFARHSLILGPAGSTLDHEQGE